MQWRCLDIKHLGEWCISLPIFTIIMKRSSNIIIASVYAFIIIITLLMMNSCACSKKTSSVSWHNSIKNPENAEFIVEVAFNEDVAFEEVTQEMFNKRYEIEE